jgi:hypothetical protein
VPPTFTRGRAIIGVCGAPFKCLPAPSEAALLLHDHLSERGVRGGCKRFERASRRLPRDLVIRPSRSGVVTACITIVWRPFDIVATTATDFRACGEMQRCPAL